MRELGYYWVRYIGDPHRIDARPEIALWALGDVWKTIEEAIPYSDAEFVTLSERLDPPKEYDQPAIYIVVDGLETAKPMAAFLERERAEKYLGTVLASAAAYHKAFVVKCALIGDGVTV